MLQQFFKRYFPYGFLVIICTIIALLYICFVKLLLIDLSTWNMALLIIFLLLYHVVFILLVWSIVETIQTDPGKVPHQWGFTRRGEQRKYCLFCHVFKPQRTHHCTTCNRCVLNMDHHCPWVNTCIGFYNRKAFVLMLFYTICINLLNILASVFCITSIIKHIQENMDGLAIRLICIIVAFVVNIVIFVAILNFFKFHIGLILQNYTTLEVLDLKRRGANNNIPQSVYDMGRYYNWMQVFGRNWGTWFIPIFGNSGGPSGDGVLWPRAAI